MKIIRLGVHCKIINTKPLAIEMIYNVALLTNYDNVKFVTDVTSRSLHFQDFDVADYKCQILMMLDLKLSSFLNFHTPS